MGFMWKEIAPNDHYCLYMANKISPFELIYVTQLYQPLIGPLSTSLYMTLFFELSMGSTESTMNNHRSLMSMIGVPLNEIVKARENLEAVGLLKTIKVEGAEDGDLYYEYGLLPPMSPSRFFADDMLNIILLNRVGQQKYRQLRQALLGKKKAAISNGNRSELTKSFDQVFRAITPSELLVEPGSETDRFLSEVEEEYPAASYDQTVGETEVRVELTEVAPDFEFLEAALPRTGIKERKLSSELRQVIKELAFLYRLDDLRLSYFLQDPYAYGDDNDIKPDRLRRLVAEWYEKEHQGNPAIVQQTFNNDDRKTQSKTAVSRQDAHKQALATVSPVTLIEQYQDGSKVSPADLKIVEELTQSYRLPSGVINVLLEYVMLTNNKQLPRSLIFKIASHWKRLGINGVEDALEQAKQLYQEVKRTDGRKSSPPARPKSPQRKGKTSSDVPEWVARQGTSEPKKSELDEEQKRQAQELLRALGEL